MFYSLQPGQQPRYRPGRLARHDAGQRLKGLFSWLLWCEFVLIDVACDGYFARANFVGINRGPFVVSRLGLCVLECCANAMRCWHRYFQSVSLKTNASAEAPKSWAPFQKTFLSRLLDAQIVIDLHATANAQLWLVHRQAHTAHHPGWDDPAPSSALATGASGL